jgi:hypothetical protein
VKYAVKLTTPIQAPRSAEPELQVHVVYAQLPGTAKTLHLASTLARGLGARVTIHLAHEIPYPLALKSPPVPVAFTEKRLLGLAAGQTVETSIQVYLCRDLTETIRQALKPESVVVVSGLKRWWRTRESSLAEALRRDGHHVIQSYAD